LLPLPGSNGPESGGQTRYRRRVEHTKFGSFLDGGGEETEKEREGKKGERDEEREIEEMRNGVFVGEVV